MPPDIVNSGEHSVRGAAPKGVPEVVGAGAFERPPQPPKPTPPAPPEPPPPNPPGPPLPPRPAWEQGNPPRGGAEERRRVQKREG
jgi:hypothetical protein